MEKKEIKQICDCIIDPDTEENHNCDVSGCPSTAHFRKGCRCGYNYNSSGTLAHHRNDCKFCHKKSGSDLLIPPPKKEKGE